MKKILLSSAAIIVLLFATTKNFGQGINYPCPNYPNGSSPFSIPGTLIPFAYHDCGDDGVAYHNNAGSGDCARNTTNPYRGSTTGICEAWSDASYKGGWMVGWLSNNEWMNYTVDITKALNYKLVVYYTICCNRVIGESSQVKFSFTPNGGTETILGGGDLDLMNNLGADILDSAVFDNIALPKKGGVIKVLITGEGLNLVAFNLLDPASIGLAEYNSNITISMYPNPVNDKLTVQLPDNNENANIVITDITGKQVLSENKNGKLFEFNTSDLTKGMYFITVKNSKGTVTKKFVKD